MKPTLVSAVAVLICCAILAVVGAFGYSRYLAAEAANQAFIREQSQKNADQQAAALLGTHLPPAADSPSRGPGEGN